jgi:hypothetical protein
MKKIDLLGMAAILAISSVSASVFAAEAAPSAGVSVHTGLMLYDSSGHRVASVYRVTAEGNPQVVLDGKLITVPATTLSEANGKVMTSLSKSELHNTH